MSTRTPPSPRFSYKSDRLKPLRAFCQTVRLGSVSRAAEALFVSQPAISLQLQALERELGVPLFERSGRRLVPSREGQLLYEMAQPLVENLDGLEARFRDKVRGLDAGELNIAANSSTILYLLPKIVERFRLHHPDVRLTLHNAISADGTDLLREDAADLAIGSMTDVPADSQVDYGTTTTYGISTTLDSAMITNHTMKLSGLKSGTTYHFRVKSKNSAGTAVASTDYSFKTLIGPPGRIRRK